MLENLRDKITVVIPTLNEAEAIGPLIEEVKACGYCNILVVDGYSTDGTDRIASGLGVEVVKQHGKGKAGGILTARDVVKTPYFIVMDGDYSYDPHDIDKFLIALNNGYDYVVGYRPKKCKNISKLHRLGNYIITNTFNLLMGSHVHDVCCGMYALKTDKAKLLHLEEHPMAVEEELAAQMVSEYKYTSVPINYRKRIGKSKTQTWRQGFRDVITAVILARRYNPVLLFSVLASLALIPALIIFLWFIYRYLFFGAIHSTYLLLAVLLAVLGAQGLTVSTIAVLLRRMERRIIDLLRKA